MDVLANWLWQGTALALVATGLLRISRRVSATTRYHLWWVTLIVVLVLPIARFVPSDSGSGAALQTAAPDISVDAGASFGTRGLSLVLPAQPRWAMALLALIWAAWSTASLCRTGAALVTLVRTKRLSRPFPQSEELRLQMWRSLRSEGRRARLVVSDDVRAAAVLGLRTPAIAVAPRTLAALTDRELDQIVVHEWAHVQRRDDVARLVQRVVVALAGLHPAVWWIDRQLHLERETACDDWAVNAAGSGKELAVCLTKLAALPGRRADGVLLPAAVLSSELTTRVVRLLDRERNTSTRWTVGAPMLVVPVLTALALVVAGVELVVTSPVAPPVPRDSGSVAMPLPEPFTRERLGPARSAARPMQGLSSRLLRANEEPARDRTQAAAPILLSEGAQSPRPTPDQTPGRIVADPPVAIARGLNAQDLPGTRTPVSAEIITSHSSATSEAAGAENLSSPTAWSSAADAGVAVGKGSQKAAVATAGFFTKLGRSISGVF
jgi:beta-lactamase regulating signal transducer with metallopeptidase domain